MLKDFRDFILRGNVVDLAVGTVVDDVGGTLRSTDGPSEPDGPSLRWVGQGWGVSLRSPDHSVWKTPSLSTRW